MTSSAANGPLAATYSRRPSGLTRTHCGGDTGVGRDADGVFRARLGVKDCDVGAVGRGPAGVDVPAVRAHRQIGHAVRHRVRRDHLVGIHVEGQDRVIGRRYGADIGTAAIVRHRDGERFVDVDDSLLDRDVTGVDQREHCRRRSE